MTQSFPSHSHPFSHALRGAGSLMAQLGIGLTLILVAGIVALMTAFVGVLLASAALFMRFAASREMKPAPAAGADGQITLDARPTPRGWTVE